jgi:hypothetical protein
MTAESFYLQCPSNASMHIFPTNTLSDFTVHLDTPLDVGEAYEVGLCEIQYPQSWDNVRRGSNTIHISYEYLMQGREKETAKEIPPGYYSTIPKLIEAIMSAYGATKKKNATLHGLDMKYNPTTRRASVSAGNMLLRIRRKNGKVHTPIRVS